MIFNLDQYKIVSTCVCDSEYGESWNLGSIYDAIETKIRAFGNLSARSGISIILAII